ncbi:hypothetical protein GGX14DRAFT_407328 [Mycena pura]|uniref:Uncharacterized protein n=1 Tax=Mycena pura TaxID=153505 RepID=A0AAD6UVH4_9AGAR|nr:hypothetical protein GGX14DRAFT_407328 [Mycena pura]
MDNAPVSLLVNYPGADQRWWRRRGRASFADSEFFTHAPGTALRQSGVRALRADSETRRVRRACAAQADTGERHDVLPAGRRAGRRRVRRKAVNGRAPRAHGRGFAESDAGAVMYHVTTLMRQLTETVAGDFARGAPLPEAAVFPLCHALAGLKAVQAILLDRVDASLASAGAAAARARQGMSRVRLRPGAAALVLALFCELEHRERQSETAGPGPGQERPTGGTRAHSRGCQCYDCGGVAAFCVEAAAAAGATAAAVMGASYGSGAAAESPLYTLIHLNCLVIHQLLIEVDRGSDISMAHGVYRDDAHGVNSSRSTYLGFSLGGLNVEIRAGSGAAKTILYGYGKCTAY